jgi:hypothetical protein
MMVTLAEFKNMRVGHLAFNSGFHSGPQAPY